MDGSIPGPEDPLSGRVAAGRLFRRQLAVLDDLSMTIDVDKHSHAFTRTGLANDIRCQEGFAMSMKANECRVGDDGCGVVDLMIEDMLNAFLPHPAQQSGILQGDDESAMPIRRHCQARTVAEQHFSGGCIQGGQAPLHEECDGLFGQREVVVGFKEFNGLIVSCIAGHNEPRKYRGMASPACENLFGKDLKQGSIGNWSDREHALGMIEPEASSLPSGNGDDRDPAGLKFSDTLFGR